MKNPLDTLNMALSTRWEWHVSEREVYPPPDMGRCFTWFAPRATGRWRAVFFSQSTAVLPEELFSNRR